MKPKLAQSINFFLCEHCHSVHIGLWRNGKMFAEAIPTDIDGVAADLMATIEESCRRQRGAPVTQKPH